MSDQVVSISPRATYFTALCDECTREQKGPGWAGSTFAGRLDLDLDAGVFLCRRGHTVRVQRAAAQPSVATEAA